MTIFQLECFCALADSLNFTQTANAMFITQPALSRAISSLEQELQLTLLQRTTHSVTLTPAGKIFSSECHKMLKEFQRGSERARSAQAGQIGSVPPQPHGYHPGAAAAKRQRAEQRPAGEDGGRGDLRRPPCQ